MKLHSVWLTVLMRMNGIYALKVKLLPFAIIGGVPTFATCLPVTGSP